MTDPYARGFLEASARILASIDAATVDALVHELRALRERAGRLFIVGNGGGAGHASHAVNDFRKLCGIEAYCPSDNVSELTARTNDEGWDSAYAEWLTVSRINERDMVLVISVGGGDRERNISGNLVRCIELAQKVRARIGGIVGRDGGATARAGHAVVVIPMLEPSSVTPQTEGLQSVIWHLLVSHPALRQQDGTWELRR